MVFRKQVFDKEGKCPQGYEFINSYSANGIYHQSYCRRIPRYRHDPEERQRNKELLNQQKFENKLRNDIEDGNNDLSSEESL